jgi:hypothetical protein
MTGSAIERRAGLPFMMSPNPMRRLFDLIMKWFGADLLTSLSGLLARYACVIGARR